MAYRRCSRDGCITPGEVIARRGFRGCSFCSRLRSRGASFLGSSCSRRTLAQLGELNMFQRRITAAVCRSLRADASTTARHLACCRHFGRKSLSNCAAGAGQAFKERLRPLGPGVVELSLDNDSGVATLVLDNPDRCNGESESETNAFWRRQAAVPLNHALYV